MLFSVLFNLIWWEITSATSAELTFPQRKKQSSKTAQQCEAKHTKVQFKQLGLSWTQINEQTTMRQTSTGAFYLYMSQNNGISS